MKYLSEYQPWFTKPKVGKFKCLVPGCGKEWFLSGSSQGFMRHAALAHIWKHWEKAIHIPQKHEGNVRTCQKCGID